MMKKPPSAKSKAAKAKREKMLTTAEPTPKIGDVLSDDVRQRLEDSFDKTWNRNDAGKLVTEEDVPWIESSYPSERPLKEEDFLTAEEALAQEEKILGKRGILDDDVPDFLFRAAKA